MFQDIFLNQTEISVRNEARDFIKNDVSSKLVKQMDKDEITYPTDFIKALGDKNLLGLRFPVEYGGRNMGWTAESAVLEEIGILGTTLGCAYSMPSIVGEALVKYGTEEQKQKFLVPMLKGDIISAEALTEPRGGSDFFGAMTTAVIDGDNFIINGQKRFIVGAEGADFFLVYCNTNPDGDPKNRISLILVEKDRGVEVGQLYGLMGTRGGGTGRIKFKDVKVPVTNLIGQLHGGALIFNDMMIPERMTSAAGALGMGRGALEVATRYSNRRKAFGRKIRKYQAVSFKIADAITKLDAARALVQGAARVIDNKQPHRRMVSEAKKFATDTAWDVVNLSMQVMGGIGYTDVYPVEKLLRDIRLIQIWTGTNEIMDLLIQHEYYREVIKHSDNSRMIEDDAINSQMDDEKVYEDDDMWIKGW